MAEFDPLAYVTAAAPLLGLDLPPDRLAEVAASFAQVARFAAPALAAPALVAGPEADERDPMP